MVGSIAGGPLVRRTLLALVAVVLAGLTARAQATPDSARLSAIDRETPWPRTVRLGGTTLVVSQPQVDTWDGFTLAARFAVRATNASHATYGVVTLDARTLTDKTSRTVVVDQANVVSARFTGVSKSESSKWAAAVASDFASPSRLIALDRLETALIASDASITTASQPLDTMPPRIVFSTVPAILVYVDSTPKYQTVPGTYLERLINTRALVLRGEGGALYLRVFDGWLRASSLAGSWRRVEEPFSELDTALAKVRQTGSVDELSGRPVNGRTGPSLEHVVPVIHIATSPTELIVTDGPGNWTPVHGLRLFYLLNTTGRVLKSGQDFKIYALVAGRWFRTDNIFGSWSYVSASALPSDFSKIPDSSPIENVKASIPGTKQAREAALAATIAETSRLTPIGAHLSLPRFDGAPTFKPLEGTSMEYAANTATPIVRVGGTVYAVQNGVWFTSSSVDGPWRLAASVPADIYTIPPTSPLYHVTYAHVFATSGDTVFVGHFPGYRGTYVDPTTQLVVYGTGYDYRTGWIDREWFGTPTTYGFGSNLTYTPWTGWIVALGLGWSWGDAVLADGRGWGVYPWWQSGNTLATWTAPAWDRPLGLSYNSRTGIASTGQRGALDNVRAGSLITQAREVAVTPSGAIVPARPGAFFKVKPGDRVVYLRDGVHSDIADVADAPAVRSTKRESADGTVGRMSDDVYAGRDGVVYRRRERGWEAHNEDGWQAARTTDAMLDRANAMRDVADWRLGMMRESSSRSRP